jgi:hypothetical protein
VYHLDPEDFSRGAVLEMGTEHIGAGRQSFYLHGDGWRDGGGGNYYFALEVEKRGHEGRFGLDVEEVRHRVGVNLYLNGRPGSAMCGERDGFFHLNLMESLCEGTAGGKFLDGCFTDGENQGGAGGTGEHLAGCSGYLAVNGALCVGSSSGGNRASQCEKEGYFFHDQINFVVNVLALRIGLDALLIMNLVSGKKGTRGREVFLKNISKLAF